MSNTEVESLQKELQNLLNKIKTLQISVTDKTLQDVCASVSEIPSVQLKTKMALRGHFAKVSCVRFSSDNRYLVSAALDGKLIIWDSWTGNKMRIIQLQSSWVMTVAYSKSRNLLACGGMDNSCTVYDLNTRNTQTGKTHVKAELSGMEGYLSCCSFLDDSQIITGSADGKIVKWDLERFSGIRSMEYEGHTGDVLDLALSPDSTTFVTGSVDKSAKVWDLRDGKCQQTFWGHESDINAVFFHNSGYYFVTCSEDKTARLFDLRADQQIGCYRAPNKNSGFTSCVVSKSGRLLFCGSDDHNVHVFDTLKEQHNIALRGHTNKVSSMSISENGMALASASWDTSVHIWV